MWFNPEARHLPAGKADTDEEIVQRTAGFVAGKFGQPAGVMGGLEFDAQSLVFGLVRHGSSFLG
jgi:hypothetical protein